MDRVLLVFDDLQYSGHLEMTLRKVGFDTETITNEYNLSEKLLTFNPDYIIVKGNSPRVSATQIGKKLKESVRYQGRVILIFPQDAEVKPEELIKLRMDLLLFEPISALRLVAHLLTLTTVDQDAIMDKLLRIAHTDSQFRQYEQQILKNSGASIDAEIQLISAKLRGEDKNERIDEKSIQTFVDPNFKEIELDQVEEESAQKEEERKVKDKVKDVAPESQLDTNDTEVNPEFSENLKAEIAALDEELPLRIASYNNAIKTVDQDLKKGLTKRNTKIEAKKMAAITTPEEKKALDKERQQFAAALWKKR